MEPRKQMVGGDTGAFLETNLRLVMDLKGDQSKET